MTTIVGLKDIKPIYRNHVGSDLTPVQAARVSTGTDATEMNERNRGLLKFLAKNKHYTPFEMIHATFVIHCPIFIARQVHRHRTFSYNEWSGMYSVVGDEFYIPKDFHKQPKKALHLPDEQLSEEEAKRLYDRLEIHCLKSKELYDLLLEKKVTRDLSRLVLPQNMMTKFWMSGNLRSWIQYIALRDTAESHLEHQHLASQIFQELLKMFPLSVAALARSSFTAETLERELGIKPQKGTI